jgi:hypothetical protein
LSAVEVGSLAYFAPFYIRYRTSDREKVLGTSSRIGLPRGIDEDETSDVVEVARIARAAIRYACVGLCA